MVNCCIFVGSSIGEGIVVGFFDIFVDGDILFVWFGNIEKK